MIEALLFGVVGLVAIDDLLKVAADALYLHGLVLIAPASRGEQDIAQSYSLGRLQRFTDVRQKIRRLGIVIVLARNLESMRPYLRAFCLIEDHVVVRPVFIRENQWNQEQIKWAVGDFSQSLERQWMHSVARQNLSSNG